MRQFVIEGRLPSLNEYIKAERSSRYAAAGMKSKWQGYVEGCILRARIRRVIGPIYIHYEHHVPDRRRDRDNIAAIVHKFTQDALVAAGVLQDDGWEYVLNSFDTWFIDSENPRIVVTIEEV